jgi:hypothetical protein
MDQALFFDLSPVEKIRALEDNATEVISNYTYELILTSEEVADLRVTFADLHAELASLEERKAEILAEINGELKGKKTTAKTLLKTIRTGREEHNGTVYLIQDFNEGQIGYYTSAGVLVSTRPMKAADRQTRISTMKTGTE